jgi:cytochrome c biogenesis factor
MNDFPANPRSTGDAPSGMNRALVIGGSILAVLTLVIVVLAVIYPGFREALRDFAVIILALFQLIGAIVMALVAIALLYAVKAIDKSTRTTLVPKLEEISVKLDDVLANTKSVSADLRKSTGEVSTTVSIITEEVVRPAIRVSSYVRGFQAVVQLLGERLRAQATPTKHTEHE